MIGRPSPHSAFRVPRRDASARRFLPNLLVPIDLRDGEPTGPSLFALCESRRVAHVAGATVYAIVMSDRELDEAVVARLGRAGADKVLLCEGAGLAAPALDATHGPALQAAVERVAPLLVLFPAGGAGMALGPSLAARIGAAFAGAADLEATRRRRSAGRGVGRVFLRRWRGGRAAYRRLDPVEIERPVIAILAAGVAAAAGRQRGDRRRRDRLRAAEREHDLGARVRAGRRRGNSAGARAGGGRSRARPRGGGADRGRRAGRRGGGRPRSVGGGHRGQRAGDRDRDRRRRAGPRWGRRAAVSAQSCSATMRCRRARSTSSGAFRPAAAGAELWSEIGKALAAFAAKAGARVNIVVCFRAPPPGPEADALGPRRRAGAGARARRSAPATTR